MLARLLSTVGLVLLCIAATATEAHATVFSATGTFDTGATLGGTLTIDTGVGTITGLDLTISGVGVFDDLISQDNLGPPLFYNVVVNDTTVNEQFLFGIHADSLVGYTGGDLCSEATGDCLASAYYPIFNIFDQTSLVSGELQALASIPEPASAFLYTAGLTASWLIFFHRIRKR